MGPPREEREKKEKRRREQEDEDEEDELLVLGIIFFRRGVRGRNPAAQGHPLPTRRGGSLQELRERVIVPEPGGRSPLAGKGKPVSTSTGQVPSAGH